MEILDLCDEKGMPTGETADRSVVHEKGLRHRTAHVWIIRSVNGRVQVLLQKRSMDKESYPGQYDTSSAGHIPAGQQPAESAVREMQEELGIRADVSDLEYAGQFRMEYEKVFHDRPFHDNEVANVYVYRRPVNREDLVLQKEEVDDADWFDYEETVQKIKERDPRFCVPPAGLKVLGDYLKKQK